jgi:hypothetical protein
MIHGLCQTRFVVFLAAIPKLPSRGGRGFFAGDQNGLRSKSLDGPRGVEHHELMLRSKAGRSAARLGRARPPEEHHHH